MADLTEKEKILLLAVWRLKENAYGVEIRMHIRQKTGRQWNYGSLYRMLDQLVKKELLKKREGRPIAESGGRRKIFYALSRQGLSALQHAFELQKTLWNGVSGVLPDEESR